MYVFFFSPVSLSSFYVSWLRISEGRKHILSCLHTNTCPDQFPCMDLELIAATAGFRQGSALFLVAVFWGQLWTSWMSYENFSWCTGGISPVASFLQSSKHAKDNVWEMWCWLFAVLSKLCFFILWAEGTYSRSSNKFCELGLGALCPSVIFSLSFPTLLLCFSAGCWKCPTRSAWWSPVNLSSPLGMVHGEQRTFQTSAS